MIDYLLLILYIGIGLYGLDIILKYGFKVR